MAERRAILVDALARVDRQVESLRGKASRIDRMIREAEDRRGHLQGHLRDIDEGREPDHPAARR